MKISRLEAHDRLISLNRNQAINISQGAEDCLKRNRLSVAMQKYSSYVYLFAHPRTSDSGLKKRMLWQPRLSKPKAQTNSYLFRARSNSDEIEVCWLLPPREMWGQYRKGNVTESEIVNWSIEQFLYNRYALERKYPDDLEDEKCRDIYRIIAREIDEEVRMEKLYKIPDEFKLEHEEGFLVFSETSQYDQSKIV